MRYRLPRESATRQGARAVEIDGGIDCRWNRHAADRADDRQRRASSIGEFAFE